MNRNSVVRIEVERFLEFEKRLHSKSEVLILVSGGSKTASTLNALVSSQNTYALFGNHPQDQLQLFFH